MVAGEPQSTTRALGVRVGLLYPGDTRSPATRSGMPHSLATALEALGVEVVHLRAEPSRVVRSAVTGAVTIARLPRARRFTRTGALRFSRLVAVGGPEVCAMHSWAAGHRIARSGGGLDGLIQVGASYTLPPGVRAVVHDDMTVRQAFDFGYPHLRALPERALRARMARQERAYRSAAACCTTTHRAARSVVHEYGVDPDRVHVVGWGRNHTPAPAGRDWSMPRFLFVGKDWERKNGPAVLGAFAQVREQIPEARLDVAGNHPAIAQEGVVTHGFVDLRDPRGRRKLDALYRASTCFVLPSLYDAGGIVFAEASAAGIPSIGTTEGGCGELIGSSGRVVHPNDQQALVNAMVHFGDPVVARAAGAQAARRADLYTWRAVAGRMLRALAIPGVPSQLMPPFLDAADAGAGK